MSTKQLSKRGRGRPAKFSAGEIQTFKNIVRKNGLLAGHQLILDAKGVSVGGKFHALTVSLPTLGKVIKQEKGGKPVELSRGRPVGTTKEVMEQRAAELVAAKKAAKAAKKAKNKKAAKPVVETSAPEAAPAGLYPEYVAPVGTEAVVSAPAVEQVAPQSDAA